MEHHTTHDDVGRFTQDIQLSLQCQKDQTPDLPLSKDPNITITTDVEIQVKLM